MKPIICIILTFFLAACGHERESFTTEVLNRYTPVKQQGGGNLCWVYAMLSAIETEHIMKGDSVELSAAWVAYWLRRDSLAPTSGRGTAMTLLRLINRYGLVPYYAMKSSDDLPPRWAFLLGAQYTPLEFAHSVCAPSEYIGIGPDSDCRPGCRYLFQSPDNWTGDSLLAMSADTLVAVTERAVREHHGACWEGDISERGFQWQRGVARPSLVSLSRTTDDHCMAVVGLARDAGGNRYFVMKNSWGTGNEQGGLLYMHYDYFRAKTLAVVLPRECVPGHCFLPASHD